MSTPTILDQRRFLLAINGPVVKAADWAAAEAAEPLLARARTLLEGAQDEVSQARAAGHTEGLESGRTQALDQFAGELSAIRSLRERVAQEHQRLIIDLATSIVARIAPSLDTRKLVPALAAEAMRAVIGEHHVTIRVAATVYDDVSQSVADWPRGGTTAIDVVSDDSLTDTDCIVETEIGVIRAGLREQLAAIRHALHDSIDESPRQVQV